ncbi:MAG: stage II sporulation protein M [Firmicutes bacterium]|nr:stage II sporulation protein M [Bacillota bacterium]
MFRARLQQHLHEHLIGYIFVVVLFSVGVVFGAVAVKALTFTQKQELLQFLRQFFSSGVATPVGTAAFAQTLSANLQLAALIWLLGVLIIGLLIVIVIVFFQGFVLGFSVGFLVDQMGMRGLLFAAGSVLPHNLLLVPAILALAAMAIHFTYQVLRPSIRQRRLTYGQRFAQYSGNALLLALIIFGASAVETWLSPALARLVARIFQ